jgi:acetyl-CoA acetyltransferase family protein
VFDTSIGWRFTNPEFAATDKLTYSMPETAEELAGIDGITREDADAFALRSHQRAVAAHEAGRFDAEMVSVQVNEGRRSFNFDADEGPRADTSLEILAGLRPVVKKDGVVTAGNSSALNDGASAVIVASEAALERFSLTPRARILDGASAGVPPHIMGIGPVPATQKVLDRTGLSVGDLGAVELNEAFAVQALACIRRLKLEEDTVNRDGGAIALGHPLGSSGARIAITLMGRMERELGTGGRRLGLATMCVGVGQGTAMLIEAV